MKTHHDTHRDEKKAGKTDCCCGTEAAASEPDARQGSPADKFEVDKKSAAVSAAQAKPKAGGCCGSC